MGRIIGSAAVCGGSSSVSAIEEVRGVLDEPLGISFRGGELPLAGQRWYGRTLSVLRRRTVSCPEQALQAPGT
jgi:hypothetical protein